MAHITHEMNKHNCQLCKNEFLCRCFGSEHYGEERYSDNAPCDEYVFGGSEERWHEIEGPDKPYPYHNFVTTQVESEAQTEFDADTCLEALDKKLKAAQDQVKELKACLDEIDSFIRVSPSAVMPYEIIDIMDKYHWND